MQNLNTKETMEKGVIVLNVSEMPQENISVEKGQSYLLQGDSYDWLKKIPENSIDSVVCDPPYMIGFMGKAFDKEEGNPAGDKEFWKLVYKTLKPGGHCLAFGGSRTYHKLAVAIEDAGFEVRDMIEWVYGSGFPKSLNIGKAVDKLQGNDREVVGEKIRGDVEKAKESGSGYLADHANRNNVKQFGYGTETLTKGTSEWEGWGTALKPAHEPICMARKPLAEKTVAENVLKYGTGGINIDESRVETEEVIMNHSRGADSAVSKGKYGDSSQQETHQTDGQQLGRFPANLIHDNSEEVRECFPETKSGGGDRRGESSIFGSSGDSETERSFDANSGNASRFFKSIIYQAKASKSDRNSGGAVKNIHPTCKPIALMEYLIKMVTPKDGTVLDPFMGSGTTGVACKNLNRNFIGIELDEDYFEIATQRINSTLSQTKLC